MNILVVEDEKMAMLVLLRTLEKENYTVFTADNGATAWEIVNRERIDFIITDWVMPGFDGPELCRMIRKARFSHYTFIILLTSKDGKADLIEGINAGADDFIAKPFNREELRARIRAGIRILDYEKELEERHKKLEEANEKLEAAYQIIENDLKLASKIQYGLLPESDIKIFNLQFNWLFLPSAYIAGDIFNYFKLDETHVAFYLLDVAGHGVPAAMLSVTLSRILMVKENDTCILKRKTDTPPYYEIVPPSQVISELNLRFQTLDETMQYFTMAYGIINTESGRVVISHAGHPVGILLKADGGYKKIKITGLPVGLFKSAEYEEIEFCMDEGDRFILYSDGVTECQNAKGVQYGLKRLVELLTREQVASLNKLTEQVEANIRKWNNQEKFEDDISFLAIERLREFTE